MDGPLTGKITLITGAGIRLGRALAVAVARAGSSVAVHFHASESGAHDTVEAIRGLQGQAQLFRADLRNYKEIKALVQEVEARMGPLACLVNSAGIFTRRPFDQTSEMDLDELWSINARAPFLLAQESARRMQDHGGRGDIVNVLDIGGAINAWRNYSAYCMTKAALASLTRSLALELAPEIRVNGVAPGTVLPPAQYSERAVDTLKQRIPQRRIGSPEDVAAAVVFFLTGPRFVTGQILAVDGGRSLNSGV